MLGVRKLDELSVSHLKFLTNYATKRIKLNNSVFPVKVVGTSMLPTIENGSVINVLPIENHLCKVGDVVCYNNMQHFVIHRIIRILKRDGNVFYKLKGDNSPHADLKLVTKEQIVGYYPEIEIPFINICYSNGDSINVVTKLREVESYLLNICPKSIIKKTLCGNNVRLNVIVYNKDDSYIIEVYKGSQRETIKKKSWLEMKGELYSIIFHSKAIKDLYGGYISLHASSVKINDKVVCLIGKTGQGKSTIVYWLAKQGYKYLGDEHFYIKIDKDDNRPRLIPFYTPIMLRKDVIASLDKNINVEKTLIKKKSGMEEKYAVGIENLLSNEIHADVIFIVPKWRRDTTTKLTKLNVQMAFDILLENIQDGVPITGNIPKTLLKLASKSVFYEMEYSNNDNFILNVKHIVE